MKRRNRAIAALIAVNIFLQSLPGRSQPAIGAVGCMIPGVGWVSCTVLTVVGAGAAAVYVVNAGPYGKLRLPRREIDLTRRYPTPQPGPRPAMNTDSGSGINWNETPAQRQQRRSERQETLAANAKTRPGETRTFSASDEACREKAKRMARRFGNKVRLARTSPNPVRNSPSQFLCFWYVDESAIADFLGYYGGIQ